MLKSHEKFHSRDGKRLILIVDDEFVNRELLRSVLEEDYELIFAENGQEALDAIRANRDELSLVLLDLLMPVMSGKDALRAMKADPEIASIPVIVLTSDQNAEIESLTLGASDFIPKPYPQPGVVKARIIRTIELSEDREIINSTERDTLTGLYNRDYFYRYAEQYDQHHRETPMDAMIVDVNHFHMINERFGTARGDEVLRSLAEALREEVSDTGGIVCRREADIFLVYCPHGLDYNKILERVSSRVLGAVIGDTHVWLRMGVYENVDRSMEVVRRFDRAKMAADTVRGSFTSQIGVYDDTLHEKELFHEQLIEDFEAAVREHQFRVYYQPKFDVQPEIPVLGGAEALVRWLHPRLGMVSPGDFIPLFEENGLIQTLDLYVWRETAKQIREWYDRFGFAVPVSVNVSRIDMYDPLLVESILEVLAENDLTPRDLRLEITESAYTQDSEQIIATVNKLRRLGFKVEMDDFGMGYSSLNMISTLPIDALKMDMMFIRNAFSATGDTKMLEVVIDIADHLSIPVIAEGVETAEQLETLRKMGCEFVQGYYFSKPLPPEEYENFITERKQMDAASQLEELDLTGHLAEYERRPFGDIAHALSSGFESIFYVDAESNHYVEFNAQGDHDYLQIENSGKNFFGDDMQKALGPVYPEDRVRVESALNKNALLAQLQTSEPFYMTYRVLRDGAPVFYCLEAVHANTNNDFHIIIGLSNVDAQITQAEALKRQRQVSISYARIAQALAGDYMNIYSVQLDTGRFIEFSPQEGQDGLGFERHGSNFFSFIRQSLVQTVHPEDVDILLSTLTRENIIARLGRDRTFRFSYRVMVDSVPIYVGMKVVLLEDETGSHIVLGVTDIDEQVRKEQERDQALRMAYRDVLTGVKSKYAYSLECRAIDQAIEAGTQEPFAVAVCDLNDLKRINDEKGHGAGDASIKEACRIVCNIFDHSPVFRIGGDEFVAIMRGPDYEARNELMEQLAAKNRSQIERGAITVAGGCAAYNPSMDDTFASVFERADATMYDNKKELKDAEERTADK